MQISAETVLKQEKKSGISKFPVC